MITVSSNERNLIVKSSTRTAPINLSRLVVISGTVTVAPRVTSISIESGVLIHLGGDDFLLQKISPPGTSHQIPLSSQELFEMVRRLPQFARQVLQSQHPSVMDAAGLEMRVLVAVRDYAVKTDIHRTMVVLHVADEFGAEMEYSFPPDHAQKLAAGLVEAASAITTATPTRQ